MYISNTNYFKQDTRPTSIEMISCGIPTIYVTPIANAKMQHYVDIVADEVGWLGIVEELESGDYLIEDVYLFEQRVSTATTEITEDALATFATEMLKRDDGMEIMNKLRFWGHSHVNMGTGPSAQDDSQMDTFESSGHDFFIRGIYNKKGEVNLCVYDYARGVIINHPPWAIYHEEEESLRDEIEQEVKEKVTRMSSMYGKPYYNRGKVNTDQYPHLKDRYRNNQWTLPPDNFGYEWEDDIDEDEDEFSNRILEDSMDDQDYEEMTEEEYEELTQKFSKSVRKSKIDQGLIPDDPARYKSSR
jgi:hypothetical protein